MKINIGFGRVLTFVYGLFALSAGARSAVQIGTKFHTAPLAYVLSAFSAVIYLVATICLAKGTPRARIVAIICCSIELAGVLAIGTLSLVHRAYFPDASVWSGFGGASRVASGARVQGYGYVPLVLPIVGLWWLLRGSRTKAEPPVPSETQSTTGL